MLPLIQGHASILKVSGNVNLQGKREIPDKEIEQTTLGWEDYCGSSKGIQPSHLGV